MREVTLCVKSVIHVLSKCIDLLVDIKLEGKLWHRIAKLAHSRSNLIEVLLVDEVFKFVLDRPFNL